MASKEIKLEQLTIAANVHHNNLARTLDCLVKIQWRPSDGI
jgi:hypothetical protein